MCNQPCGHVLISVFVVTTSSHQCLGNLVVSFVVKPGEIRVVAPQVRHTGVQALGTLHPPQPSHRHDWFYV